MQSPHDVPTKAIDAEPLVVEAPVSGSGDRWIGKRVGNYVVDRPLARGGMGAVYVARHPHLGREVAVKFLSHSVSAHPEIAARFLSEARVTASLNHPNIVEILDFGELDGELYYAMELLRGKSLRAVMREKGRLPSSAIRPYIEQICWALEAAHRAGIVHRDLKPANVLVLDGEPLRLKLLDFGVAKLMSSGPTQTRAGQVLGTATHMAPEQALGDPNRVTPQSDLYALGAIAYEMLTGSPVFHHESDVMLMVMHVRDAIRPIEEHVPEVIPAVARLVEACLAKNPDDRPSSARALADELAKALLATPPRAPARSTPAPTQAAAAPGTLADQPTHFASTVPPPTAEVAVRPEPLAEPKTKAAAAAPAPAGKAHAPAPAPAHAKTQESPPAPVAAKTQESPPAPVAAKTQESPPAPVAAAPWRKLAAAPAAPAAPVVPVKRALAAAPVAEAPLPTAEATIGTLTSRLQRRGDFPAFARTVGEVSHKADANGAFSAGQLGESILKDYALTAKLLRIVNATYARRFGGKNYSVQHAIVILGFDRVRSLALSIGLFKTSGTGKEPSRVSESAISALVSGELARSLAVSARVNDDEAMICAMFKNLGRHLTLVYLPELFDRIEALVSEGLAVPAAAKRVLGLSFEELGTAIAKSWQLPQQIVSAMAASELPEGQLKRNEDRVNALAAFTNELCDVMTRESEAARERSVRELLVKYKGLVSLEPEALAEILAQVEASLSDRYEALLGGDLKSSRFVANVNSQRAAGLSVVQLGVKPGAPGAPSPAVPLDRRIREVREGLERGQAPDAVLGLALRLLADHFGASAPLVLTLAPNRRHLVVRFGLRDDIEGLRRELRFPMRSSSGNRTPPFASAHQAGKDLVIRDCFAPECTETMPVCYYEVLGSQALALYACLGKGVSPALVLVGADSADALPDAARVAELAELRPLIARAAARA
jgi:HD-like signal output (HDOD) protein/predicted Ser/Thr protein kinase